MKFSIFKKTAYLRDGNRRIKKRPQIMNTTFSTRIMKISCLIFFHIIFIKRKGKNKQ